MATLMGKKRGMAQFFDEKGNIVPCTVIEIQPNVLVQKKNKETDGYDAIQLGFGSVGGNSEFTVQKRIGKPRFGHFKKKGLVPLRHLHESRLDSESEIEANVGDQFDVTHFQDVSFVDVKGVSKGKGYQGVMKRYHFAGGPKSHGSGFHRHGGSTGMRSTPGRTLPMQKKAGHMGHENVTVQNLKVVRVDIDNHVLLIEGSVPGPRDGLVYVSPAIKKRHPKSKKK